jgi:ubiquinone/menaquinone biosynthesis C-methylase UbiE
VTALSERLLTRYYSSEHHPYRVFERRVDQLLKPTDVLLDAGCGRSAPVLRHYLGRAQRLIGVEVVEFTDVPAGIETHNSDLANLPLGDSSVDLIMSRSVFEHLSDPSSAYKEFARVLRPGGRVVFLTANMWDYGTLVARMVPNRFHARIVERVEGREEQDTFPTEYKTNTRAAVNRHAKAANLEVEAFDYLNQYPNYLMFNGALFLLGVWFERLTSYFNALRFLRGWILVTLRKDTKPRSPSK